MIKAKPKNINFNETIYFDAKNKISLSGKIIKAIYNSNNDNYERLAEIHNVDVDIIKKIKGVAI